MNHRFYFDKTTINRSAHLRQNDRLQIEQRGITTVFIPVWNNMNLVTDQAIPRGVFLKGAEADWIVEKASGLYFLGTKENLAFFGADLSHIKNLSSTRISENTVFADLRGLATTLNTEDAGYLAYARALSYWNNTHVYCGICGSQTKSMKGGHERICSNDDCRRVHFPRTDPAVIMLITHPNEEKCLLGRNRRFRGLRFSTIAGFVEPGESLENAVIREVNEETGVKVTDVRYMASQPWPFPASIMIGFRAKGTSAQIICADNELLEAHWFTREEVRDLANKENILPPSQYSISRWLIDSWLEEKNTSPMIAGKIDCID